MIRPFHTSYRKEIATLLWAGCIALLPLFLWAQPGAKAIYHYQSAPAWNNSASEYFRSDHKVLEHYAGAGISYWFEHVRYNFGMAPGLYLLQSSTRLSGRDTTFRYTDKTLGFEVDMTFFPFHPIKLNPWLDAPPMDGKTKRWKTSLFLQCTPAVVWHHKRIDPAGEKHNGLNFKIDFGLGYQMYFLPHIGLSPIIKAGIQPGLKWPGFAAFHEVADGVDKTLGTFASFSLYFFYY